MSVQPRPDDRIETGRLVLVPVTAGDADELAAIFADERLYVFTGGRPGTVEDLRATLGRLAEGRATDPAAQRNWVVRRLVDGDAVGTHASEAVAIRAGLSVTGETPTTPKHDHIERRWQRPH